MRALEAVATRRPRDEGAGGHGHPARRGCLGGMRARRRWRDRRRSARWRNRDDVAVYTYCSANYSANPTREVGY
ncbi:hypothetical protein E2562_030596 [Oryza meyeriana var. granulata]|uniref:Uncharacterized protein n=1 Tax=Oryza meyeriana var. granulata TaxID=110450 RepID=A0A6G1ER85_9ORYZ|nr:hypothetical protein E2562_030596 [Oryza meyeriana var. granulata]